jgi:hypothetical protein
VCAAGLHAALCLGLTQHLLTARKPHSERQATRALHLQSPAKVPHSSALSACDARMRTACVPAAKNKPFDSSFPEVLTPLFPYAPARSSAGALTCYASANACPGSCVQRPKYCATGAATQSNFTWVSSSVLNSITAVAQPNGAGQLCYVNQADCESSQFSHCSSASPTRCVSDTASCSTGIAGDTGDVIWLCPQDQPASAVANGGGAFCFDSLADCLSGPGACTAAQPCVLDTATCATGQASGSSTQNWCGALVSSH